MDYLVSCDYICSMECMIHTNNKWREWLDRQNYLADPAPWNGHTRKLVWLIFGG